MWNDNYFGGPTKNIIIKAMQVLPVKKMNK